MASKKTNGKDPAVLLYTQDFIVGTITMTHEQRGKYIMLLCLQHQKGKLTMNDLKQYLNDEDIIVAEKFPMHTDGFYYNDRMQMEIENRKIFTDSRRSNGSKGGRPKNNLNNTIQKPNGYPYGKPNENHTGDANEDANEIKDKLLEVYNAPDIIEIENTDVDYMIDETDIEITRPMLERIIEKFIAVDSRFKLQSVISEINEDYGGFDNLIEMYLPNDISAQNNYKNKLKQYKNGIYA